MSPQLSENAPRLGMLLVALGYVTREQLEACLFLQSQDYAGVPLGQILVRCNYISSEELQRVLHLQSEIERAILAAAVPPQPECRVLLFSRREHPLLLAHLHELGVSINQVREWAEQGRSQLWQRLRPDAILIDVEQAGEFPFPSSWSSLPLWLIHPDAAEGPVPGMQAALKQFIRSVLERRNLQERLSRHRREESITATLIRRISTVHSSHEALEQLLVGLAELVGVEGAVLFRLDRRAGQLVFELVLGSGSEQLQGQRLPLSQGLAGWVARNQQPLIVPDARKDQRFAPSIDAESGLQTRSLLCVPLVAFGELWGVLQLLNKHNGLEFTKSDLRLLRTLGSLAALLMSRPAAGR